MAQSDWPAGTEMTVELDGTEYPFKTVSVNPKVNLINRSNSKYTPSYRVKRAGQLDLTITADGPYREGETALVPGNEYTVTVKPTAAHVGYEAVMILEDAEFSDDVEDGPNMRATFQVQSTYTLVLQ